MGCDNIYPQDPNSMWNFCPNLGASILFCVLYGLTTSTHIAQAFLYKKRWCWVLIMGGTWETLAYIFRSLSVQSRDNQTYYIIQQILILLAPLWINAFVYMVIGRMVYNFMPNQKALGIKAQRIALCFVLLDIVAFLTQAVGANWASQPNISDHTMMLGLHIYMAGIGFQQFFILLFTALPVTLHRHLAASSIGDLGNAKRLLFFIYAVLALITVRIIFRLIEYSGGVNGPIPTHEVFPYCFDALPMLMALVLLNVKHPGTVLRGPESEYPKKSRKQKKAEKESKKMAKKSKNTKSERTETLYETESPV